MRVYIQEFRIPSTYMYISMYHLYGLHVLFGFGNQVLLWNFHVSPWSIATLRRSDARAMMKRPAACIEGAGGNVEAIPASGSKTRKTTEVKEGGAKAKAAPAAKPKAKANVKASAKPKAKGTSKASASAPDVKSKAKPKESGASTTKPRPPPMEQGQGTVYYMQGKVHRNSGCFRVFKRSTDRNDLKIKIVPDVSISELWGRALDVIETAAAEPWDVS